MRASATCGTEFEGCCTKVAWLRLRKMFPEEVQPCTVSAVDMGRNKQTTHTKVKGWFDMNKRTLVESGLAIDSPMTLPDGTITELTIGEIKANWIINFDKTDHPLISEFDKGGNCSIRRGDNFLPRGAQRVCRSNTHTTGLYGSTADGTPMPPVYIFDTKTKDEGNFQLKHSWCKNLPKVRGKYGFDQVIESDSYVSVRHSGCSDEELIQELIEKVYLLLYPNVAKETTRDSEGKFISGPVLLKTDSGQGRFSHSWENLKFRERMAEKGVLLVLGLPNSTSYTQEQDQLYQDFKQCLRTKQIQFIKTN